MDVERPSRGYALESAVNVTHQALVRWKGTLGHSRPSHCGDSRCLVCGEPDGAPKLHNEEMLVILSGLPGVGKTTVARELARQIGAVHLRIDSIEDAIRGSAASNRPGEDVGYRVAYAIAEDNLRIGRTIVADSVNPLRLTRDAWLNVAKRAGVTAVEIEIRCSATEEHRRRVEARAAEIPGLTMPTWADVVAREYHSWDREHLVIDSANRTIDDNVCAIRAALKRSTIGQSST